MSSTILPSGINIKQGDERMLLRTLAGTYAPLGSVTIEGMRLPSFDKSCVINEHDFQVFDSECQYDVILGGDFLEKIGLNFEIC